MNSLYIVPTPIGNLEDITLRALRILREVRLIAAEDTRTTRKLLDRYEITTPLTAYHEHNKVTKLDTIFNALEQGDVALVSDAGTPGISDPGFELIREAIARDINVISLPGASAVVTALVASGLPTDGYVYLGFFPRKQKALHEALTAIINERRTLVAYESPNRLTETLEAILTVFGDRPVAVAREITKLYEEIKRGPVSEVLTYYKTREPRGEITLVIGGAVAQVEEAWSEQQVIDALQVRLENGEIRSQAVKAIAEQSGWNRRDVYDLSLEL